MAQIVKRTKKDGSTTYLFRVSVGYSVDGKHITQSQTYTPPAVLTGRKLEKEVQRRAGAKRSFIHSLGWYAHGFEQGHNMVSQVFERT